MDNLYDGAELLPRQLVHVGTVCVCVCVCVCARARARAHSVCTYGMQRVATVQETLL